MHVFPSPPVFSVTERETRAMAMAFKKLIPARPRPGPAKSSQHLQPSPPSATPSPLPDLTDLPSLPPLPALTLLPARQSSQLTAFLATHLRIPLTPAALLHFLKSKLHHHPHFTLYDFHIFNWASKLDSFRHDHSTFEWMVRTLAVSNRLDDLSSLLQFMSANPCPCSDGIFSCPRVEPIFGFAIDSYCRAGRLKDAEDAFGAMRKSIDGRPSVASYNSLIHGLVKSGELEKALYLYDRMVRDRVKPDVVTFNILISGYCRNSRFESALDVFREMKDKGCVPNVVSFNTLIRGFFRMRKFKEGIAMAYEMIELGCQFSSVTCEILVDGLCREGEADQAKATELLLDFARKGVLPVGYDYFNIVDKLCSSGSATRALETVNELWERGNPPSLITCTSLVEGLRRARKLEESLVLMEKMLKEALVPDTVTFNCLLEDLCLIGKTAQADDLRLLAQSKGLEPDEVTYRALVYGCMRDRMREEGGVLVDEMLDKGFIPDLMTYNRYMEGLSNPKFASRSQR